MFQSLQFNLKKIYWLQDPIDQIENKSRLLGCYKNI